MTPDLNTMIDQAHQMFQSIQPLMPILGVLFGISFAYGLYHSVMKAYRKELDKAASSLEVIELPTDKPKNDERAVAGIGDDGELVFEDDPEPSYMRRFK